MHPCVTCGCSTRQGTTVAAILSIPLYLIELIAVVLFGKTASRTGNGEEIMAPVNEESYYGLIAVDILMIALSVLLFIGARYYSICMVIPWIIATAFIDMFHLVLLVTSVVCIINGYHVLYLTAFLSSLFIFLLISYLLWIAMYFMFEMIGQQTNFYRSFGSKSKADTGINLGDDGENGDPDETTPVKKNFFSRAK